MPNNFMLVLIAKILGFSVERPRAPHGRGPGQLLVSTKLSPAWPPPASAWRPQLFAAGPAGNLARTPTPRCPEPTVSPSTRSDVGTTSRARVVHSCLFLASQKDTKILVHA